MRRFSRAAVPVICAILAESGAYAQRGVGDWSTAGFDAQRSSWVRGDAKISLAALRKPGFSLEWKLNLNEKRAGEYLLSPALLIDFYIGYRGFRSLGFVGSGRDAVVGIDTDLGRVEWKKDFKNTAAVAGAGDPCQGGMTPITRPAGVAYPPLSTLSRGAGRGTPAKSAVGEPGEGAVTLKTAMARMATAPPASPKPTPQPVQIPRRPAPDNNPFAPRVQYVHALTSDGKLHSLWVSNGEEPNPAVQFIGANANASGLIVVDNVAYVSTSNGCGGVANGVWSLDLPSKKASQWQSGANTVSATAFGPDGALYVTSGGELVALEEKTLSVKSSHKLASGQFSSGPIVFDFKGKDLIAAASDAGVHLWSADSLKAPVASISSKATGPLTSWQDPSGARWILAPAGGAITAWKVVEQGGVKLEQGWVSRELASPVAPIVVADVVFAVSGGTRGKNAVLYALDSATGKEVWSSGDTIKGFVTKGGLAAGGSRIYVGTQDGTQYVFGFPIEH